MECRFRVLLRCPTCLRVFCVPELAGSSVIWHSFCEDQCERIAHSDQAEHCDRASLKFDREHNRLVIDAEGQ